MAVYNLIYVANSTDLLTLTQRINTELMGGYFGIMLLVAIGTVAFMSFHWSTRDAKRSVLATAFLMFILSVLLRALGLVPNLTLFVTLVACALSVAFTLKS